MNKLLGIHDTAKLLGVAPQTLRRWKEKEDGSFALYKETKDAMTSPSYGPFDRSNKT